MLVRRPAQRSFVHGASSSYFSWTRGLTSTPHCRLRIHALEHALQTSMTWVARRCRRDMEAIMEVIYPRCAGLEVHKQTVIACVRIAGGNAPTQEIRTFPTTTSGLLALADWLESWDVEHVGMEATDVYWKPVWHVPEARLGSAAAGSSGAFRDPPSPPGPQERQYHYPLQCYGDWGIDRGRESDRCIAIDSDPDNATGGKRSGPGQVRCHGRSVAKRCRKKIRPPESGLSP